MGLTKNFGFQLNPLEVIGSKGTRISREAPNIRNSYYMTVFPTNMEPTRKLCSKGPSGGVHVNREGKSMENPSVRENPPWTFLQNKSHENLSERGNTPQKPPWTFPSHKAEAQAKAQKARLCRQSLAPVLGQRVVPALLVDVARLQLADDEAQGLLFGGMSLKRLRSKGSKIMWGGVGGGGWRVGLVRGWCGGNAKTWKPKPMETLAVR